MDTPTNTTPPDALGPDPDGPDTVPVPAPDGEPLNAWDDDNDFDDDGTGAGMLKPIPRELAG